MGNPTLELVKPTEAEETQAKESLEVLVPLEQERRQSTSPDEEIKTVSMTVEGRQIEVPALVYQMFLRLLTEIAAGNAVTLIPYHSELTTQQAADILNVSRPYVVKLLNQGKIPFRKVNRHRRIRFDDLMEFKRSRSAQREADLLELMAEGQRLGMGYDI
jgi:excisionase family DNA binding protein